MKKMHRDKRCIFDGSNYKPPMIMFIFSDSFNFPGTELWAQPSRKKWRFKRHFCFIVIKWNNFYKFNNALVVFEFLLYLCDFSDSGTKWRLKRHLYLGSYVAEIWPRNLLGRQNCSYGQILVDFCRLGPRTRPRRPDYI